MGNAEDFTKEFMKDMFGGGGKGQPMQQQPPPMQQQQQQQQQQFQQQPMQQQSYNSPQGLYSEDAIKKEAARG